MLTASHSKASALAGRKRKAIDVDPESICRSLLGRMRQQEVFSSIADDDWESVTAAVLADPDLTKPSISNIPFTEAQPFYYDLFQDGIEPIRLREDTKSLDTPSPTADPYEEAAAALRKNVLWESVREHVVIDNEASSRTVIDLVVLTAVELAQRQITEQEEVDEDVCSRYSLTGPKWSSDSNSRPVGSRVVLHQEVDIPGQVLLPNLALHGILDYLIGVVPADAVNRALLTNPAFLKKAHLYAPPDALRQIGASLVSIHEAKAQATIDSLKSWSQVTAQGVALCVLTKRKSVVNTLTDGRQWRFVQITKSPDQAPSSPSSSVSTGSRRTSGRLASSKLPKPLKPFAVSATRTLDIYCDLAIVLRLLTHSILASPEMFKELAAVGKIP